MNLKTLILAAIGGAGLFGVLVASAADPRFVHLGFPAAHIGRVFASGFGLVHWKTHPAREIPYSAG